MSKAEPSISFDSKVCLEKRSCVQNKPNRNNQVANTRCTRDRKQMIGMLLAAELFLLWRGQGSVLCCKLHHENDSRCIFRCRYQSCVMDRND